MSEHLTLAALLAAFVAGGACGIALMLLRPRDTLAVDLWQATLDAQINEIVRLERAAALERGRTAILQRERRDHYGEAIAERRGKV